MSKSTVHKVSLGVLAVLVVTVGLALVGVFFRSGPLAGPRGHDFGLIWIEGDQIALDHTFRLTNRLPVPIVVSKIIPSCGCTTVAPQQTIIEPGAVFVLPTTLRLSGTGEKKSHIDLVLDREGEIVQQTVWVKAVGRRRQTLWARDKQLRLGPGDLGVYRFIAEILEHDDQPPDPRLTVTSGLDATFLGWRRGQKRNRRLQTPSIWNGSVRVTLDGGPLPEGAELRLELSPDQQLTVPITGAAMLPASGLSPPGPAAPPESPGSPAPDDR